MSEPYALAPEFASQPTIPIPANRLLLRGFNLLLRLQRRGFTWGDRVVVRTHSVPGHDGNVTRVFEIAPRNRMTILATWGREDEAPHWISSSFHGPRKPELAPSRGERSRRKSGAIDVPDTSAGR